MLPKFAIELVLFMTGHSKFICKASFPQQEIFSEFNN